MKTVMDSVNEITPELLYSTRTSRAVNGRAVASDASGMSSGMSEDEGGAFAPRGARRAALRSMSSEPKRASEPNPKAPHADDDKRGEVSR